MNIEKRAPGKTDLSVRSLTFGGNVFGWIIDHRTSFGYLNAFAGNCFNQADTADSYCRWDPGIRGGKSETIIGK